MKGGSANKLVVYKRRNQSGCYFPKEFADERAVWETLRAGFIEAFELAEAGRWSEVDQIEILQRCSALKLKTLHLYFPDDCCLFVPRRI